MAGHQARCDGPRPANVRPPWYNRINDNERGKMNYNVTTTLDRKYGHAPHLMVDPYTEARNGALYLVSQSKYQTAIRIDGIVDVEEA